MTAPDVLLVDSVEGPPRTTATLVASLAARLGTLFVTSGADVIGSLAAGVVRVGREVAETADGRRAKESIESGLAGHNGAELWRTLRIEEWISQMPASPVLAQLRNDYSLLLAPDLDEVLQSTPAASQASDDRSAVADEPASFVHFVLGLWFISGELNSLVETLISTNGADGDSIVVGPEQTTGPLLR